MNNDKVNVKDVLSKLFKYKISIILIVGTFLSFSLSLSEFLQKSYKSQFEVNIYSKYFKNPLISEIVPGVYNIPEMRFTIDSMVKEAINDDYLDQLAHDYKFYSLDLPEEKVARQRQMLRERFKYYSTGGQSYRVSFEDSDPYRAKKIAETTLDRVRGHFINNRIDTIEVVKQIMLQRLQALNASQKITTSGSDKALASRSPEVLSAELKKINTNIAALQKQYNKSHPKLQELFQRKETISNWLEEFKSQFDGLEAQGAAVAMPMDKEVNGQLTGKFFAKFHDFNMALDIEKKSLASYIGVIERPQLPITPIWPKRRLFASLGFLLGVSFAFIYIVLKELYAPSRVELMKSEAKSSNTIFLGALKCPTEKYKTSSIGHRARTEPQILNH
ncbi:MAG: hypothetical protein CME64_18260 [Halobacteriovoraceae bacterium]|nr:hypothetical protein [Halobacteriovoraceae bacterium]|tara:strand:+ start:5159 stop:6325 length:1167 start_codon:yes stop_codon:yes gene_type:complete